MARYFKSGAFGEHALPTRQPTGSRSSPAPHAWRAGTKSQVKLGGPKCRTALPTGQLMVDGREAVGHSPG